MKVRTGKPYSEPYTIDIEHMFGAAMSESTLTDVVESLKAIKTEVEKLGD